MSRCDSTADPTAFLEGIDDTNHNSMNDTTTLDAIAAVLLAHEWPTKTLDEIVNLVRASGRNIADPTEETDTSTSLDDEVLRRIRSGAVPSEDVEILPCQPTRGSDDGWWVEVRVWVPDRNAY